MAGEEQDDGYTDIAKEARHDPADRLCCRRDEVHALNLPEVNLKAWCPPCRGTFKPMRESGNVDPALAAVLLDREVALDQFPPRDFVDFDLGRNKIAVKGQDLREWWLDLASSEVEPLIAKAIEYGGEGRALDLIEIGRAMVHAGVKLPPLPRMMKRGSAQPTEADEAWLAELGIYFYLQGKFARWTAAIAEGRPVSDDTLHDIGIYVRMAQRIRAVGGWPV